jgi:ribosomal protein L11 methyltransferase
MTSWKALTIKVKRQYIDPLSGFLYLRRCVGLSYDEITIDERSTLPERTAEDVTDVTAYFPRTSDVRMIAEELREFVAGLPRQDGSFAVDSVEVEDFGWADRWKEFFRPIKIGRSVTVTPSWEKWEAEEGETVIIIDPGEAFGTGSHETTRLCIELIEKEFEREVPEKCLDIGCGTGILGILMAKKGAKEVFGIDIDNQWHGNLFPGKEPSPHNHRGRIRLPHRQHNRRNAHIDEKRYLYPSGEGRKGGPIGHSH